MTLDEIPLWFWFLDCFFVIAHNGWESLLNRGQGTLIDHWWFSNWRRSPFLRKFGHQSIPDVGWVVIALALKMFQTTNQFWLLGVPFLVCVSQFGFNWAEAHINFKVDAFFLLANWLVLAKETFVCLEITTPFFSSDFIAKKFSLWVSFLAIGIAL